MIKNEDKNLFSDGLLSRCITFSVGWWQKGGLEEQREVSDIIKIYYSRLGRCRYSLGRPRERWHLEWILFLEKNGRTGPASPRCPQTRAEWDTVKPHRRWKIILHPLKREVRAREVVWANLQKWWLHEVTFHHWAASLVRLNLNISGRQKVAGVVYQLCDYRCTYRLVILLYIWFNDYLQYLTVQLFFSWNVLGWRSVPSVNPLSPFGPTVTRIWETGGSASV